MTADQNSPPVVIVDRYPYQDNIVDLSQYPDSIVFTRNRRLHEQDWHRALGSQNFGHHRPVNFLEVGCQEGSATLWFLEHYLGHENSRVTMIDVFHGRTLDTLKHNLGVSGFNHKADVRKGMSGEILRELPLYSMDVIYVDGLHSAFAVIEDAVLGWRLLKDGGLLIFDDYKMSGRVDPMDRPAPAIDFFLEAFRGKFEVIDIGNQVALKKTYPNSKLDRYISEPLKLVTPLKD